MIGSILPPPPQHVVITSGEGEWFDCSCQADDGSVPVQVLVQCITTKEHAFASMPNHVTKSTENCVFKRINTAEDVDKLSSM